MICIFLFDHNLNYHPSLVWAPKGEDLLSTTRPSTDQKLFHSDNVQKDINKILSRVAYMGFIFELLTTKYHRNLR